MLMEGINREGLETRLCLWYVRGVVRHNLKLHYYKVLLWGQPAIELSLSLDVSLSDILVQFRTILQYRYGGVA